MRDVLQSSIRVLNQQSKRAEGEDVQRADEMNFTCGRVKEMRVRGIMNEGDVVSVI